MPAENIYSKRRKKLEDLLRPRFYFSTFWHIDFQGLAGMGIEYLIIDVDSTIASINSFEVDERAKETLENILKSGLMQKACLVSNTIYSRKEKRVKAMAELMMIPYVTAGFFYQKPRRAPFLKALKIMGAPPEKTAVIGDQLYTDILGGNRLGMITVLVKPLGPIHWTSFLALRWLRGNRFLKKMGLQLDDLVDKVEHDIEDHIKQDVMRQTEAEIKREASRHPKQDDKPDSAIKD